MEIKPEFMFDVDFQCPVCGSIIGVKTYLAVVKSMGVEVTCKHCKTTYFVTEEGARYANPSTAPVPQAEGPAVHDVPTAEDAQRL